MQCSYESKRLLYEQDEAGTFLTLRIVLTWAVLEACGPPVWMDWDISSEYILCSRRMSDVMQKEKPQNQLLDVEGVVHDTSETTQS